MAEKKFTIEQPFLVLVEGKDEETLFKLLAARDGIADIQFHCYQGGKQLQKVLPIIASLPEFSSLKGLGIEQDAEDSSGNAFRSISDLIARVNLARDISLANPTMPFLAAGSDPRVVVWIKPRGFEQGAIEDIVLQSITNRGDLDCIDRFIQCAQACPDQSLCNMPSKTKVYAYISIQENPKLDLARAFQNDYFDLDHPAYGELREFLRMVCGR